jgi:integrase
VTGAPSASSYAVRIWSVEPYKGKRGTTYRVRWRVEHRRHGRTFATRKLAESFVAELTTHLRRGEQFYLESGLPRAMLPPEPAMSWVEHAAEFADAKWARASARHRKGLAEALTTITEALWSSEAGVPAGDELRKFLRSWVFNRGARRASLQEAEPGADHEQTLAWILKRSMPLERLAEQPILRRAVDACATKLDGTPAARSTTTRKRSALFSALDFAVEQGRLDKNPMSTLRSPRLSYSEAVDSRVVVNPDQARALLTAVEEIYPSLKAFFACLYYAGLRPAEARHLRAADLVLPEHGWGKLTLSGSTQSAGAAWTDAGTTNEDRALKHRAPSEARIVPAHPELVTILRWHIETFELSPDRRLFVARTGVGGRPLPRPFSKPLAMGTVYRIWRVARERTLTPAEVDSPLARRPYDLRHACVSTWLNAGVPVPQVAAWAGHSVTVLLRVYAKCVSGQEALALQRITDAMGPIA